jgi:hypothetical protein
MGRLNDEQKKELAADREQIARDIANGVDVNPFLRFGVEILSRCLADDDDDYDPSDAEYREAEDRVPPWSGEGDR